MTVARSASGPTHPEVPGTAHAAAAPLHAVAGTAHAFAGTAARGPHVLSFELGADVTRTRDMEQLDWPGAGPAIREQSRPGRHCCTAQCEQGPLA